MAAKLKLPLADLIRWTLAVDQIRREVDSELADILDRVAEGDESAWPEYHDRLLVIGRPELADRLRKLMAGRA